MRSAETVVWPGGESTFRLDIGALRAIEKLCDAGPNVILMRLLGGAWRVDDVIAVLRLGLIGGGMPEKEAGAMMERALNGSSLHSLAIPAADVLRRFIMWDEDDAPGEAKAGEGNRTHSRTDEPGGQATSDQAPPLD